MKPLLFVLTLTTTAIAGSRSSASYMITTDAITAAGAAAGSANGAGVKC